MRCPCLGSFDQAALTGFAPAGQLPETFIACGRSLSLRLCVNPLRELSHHRVVLTSGSICDRINDEWHSDRIKKPDECAVFKRRSDDRVIRQCNALPLFCSSRRKFAVWKCRAAWKYRRINASGLEPFAPCIHRFIVHKCHAAKVSWLGQPFAPYEGGAGHWIAGRLHERLGDHARDWCIGPLDHHICTVRIEVG